jgi:hypothetical protein
MRACFGEAGVGRKGGGVGWRLFFFFGRVIIIIIIEYVLQQVQVPPKPDRDYVVEDVSSRVQRNCCSGFEVGIP